MDVGIHPECHREQNRSSSQGVTPEASRLSTASDFEFRAMAIHRMAKTGRRPEAALFHLIPQSIRLRQPPLSNLSAWHPLTYANGQTEGTASVADMRT